MILNISSVLKVRIGMMMLLNIFAIQFAQVPENHTIPEVLQDEINVALSYYPDLKDAEIEFRFKSDIKKSTMQARPKFGSFFKSRKNRAYVVLISENFKISNREFKTIDMPRDVMIGWIGHELGHIMDYRNRSKSNLIKFGIKYLYFDNFIANAERRADSYAVASGMEEYILKAKEFILSNSDIDVKYLARIKKYYLSPEEILELVNEREAKEASAL
ncbi:hypothetical protein [Portibacter lacus]|uniref:Uncharacterized protein n=1 Tax=Portibacter lacus TaxID=1099794 RepID=A0AA37SMH3_9BACT|nr:hypothetical protein [Portibacter lacus]GLR15669.1 hypothetical protein GCM10007940_02840 [Portibacter lacus]